MTQTGLRKPRRTKTQLEEDLLNGLERLVVKMGFMNIPLYMITQEAEIDSNVFYRRYSNVNELFARLAHRYDSWINELVTPEELEKLGDRKALIKTLQRGFISLSENMVMQKLLLWELSDNNEVTKHTIAARQKSTQALVKHYSEISRGMGVDIKSSIIILVAAIYFIALRRNILDNKELISNQDNRDILAAIEMMVNLLFDKIERNERLKYRITIMLKDGITPENIQRYLEITPSEYEFALA